MEVTSLWCTAAMLLTVATLAGCDSEHTDEGTWREDLDQAGITFPSDQEWQDYRHTVSLACAGDRDVVAFLAMAMTELPGSVERRQQGLRLSLAHACPQQLDRVDDAKDKLTKVCEELGSARREFQERGGFCP